MPLHISCHKPDMRASYAIVIDTNIVRGASSNENNMFTEILLAFRANGHLVAMSAPLLDEWFKVRADSTRQWEYYISFFASQWLAEMNSRQRVKRYDLDFALEEQVLAKVHPARVKEVQKDMHLVLTALAADKRIISDDRRERRDLQEAGERFPMLCGLVWPPLDQVCDWLANGAQKKAAFILC